MRRESGVAVTRDGAFTYRGRPIENTRVAELFMRGLDVRADGQVTLTVGRFVAYPEVETVARFVRWIHPATRLVTLMDAREARIAHVAYGPDDRFYVWLTDLRGPAVLLREAHQVLAGWLGDQEGDGLGVGSLAAIPRADSSFPTDDAVLGGDRAKA